MRQQWLDKRRPGQNKNTTQRNEPDAVRILSGVFDGMSTGTPIQLMIENTDQRSKDYGDIAQTFRPGHADITYYQKYGNRAYRGGGRSSARETAARVAAGGYLGLGSCWQGAERTRFRNAAGRGIGKAGRRGRLIHTGDAGPDHPQMPQLAESGYLKAVFFRLD